MRCFCYRQHESVPNVDLVGVQPSEIGDLNPHTLTQNMVAGFPFDSYTYEQMGLDPFAVSYYIETF